MQGIIFYCFDLSNSAPNIRFNKNVFATKVTKYIHIVSIFIIQKKDLKIFNYKRSIDTKA